MAPLANTVPDETMLPLMPAPPVTIKVPVAVFVLATPALAVTVPVVSLYQRYVAPPKALVSLYCI